MAYSAARNIPIGEALDSLPSLAARGVLAKLAHRGPASLETLAAHPNDDRNEVQAALEDMAARSYVTRDNSGLYAAAVTGRAW